jgi:hypothetical protein
MMRTMWFGTRRYARWIKTHSPGSEYTALSHLTRLEYLNGGVGLRRSAGSHEELTLTWNRLSEQDAREIADFAYGVYGDGPFYLSDPGTQRLNVLNKAWSMPALGAKDAPPLAGTVRPSLVNNALLTLGYPAQMAQYLLTAADARRTFYLPIPPGHTAWVGVHGDTGSTLGLRAQPTLNGTATGAATTIPATSVTSTTRVTHSFPAPGEQAGLEISIAPGAGRFAVAGIIAQILPTGTTPETGGFISGQGMTGADIEGVVRPTPYSYAHNSYGLSMKLVETEDHL